MHFRQFNSFITLIQLFLLISTYSVINADVEFIENIQHHVSIIRGERIALVYSQTSERLIEIVSQNLT
jgi:hypothetical protein